MDKCIIVRHTLGKKSWYVVTQNGLELSTPLETFAQATAWAQSMSGYQWASCYRLTDDLTEVQLFDKVSL